MHFTYLLLIHFRTIIHQSINISKINYTLVILVIVGGVRQTSSEINIYLVGWASISPAVTHNEMFSFLSNTSHL